MNENRFRQAVVATLAKRAANRCSNPDCGAITSGPTDDRNDAVNIGVAAHIYGANPGSARYNADMVSVDRSDISNAIWLCGNCHKLVDDDENKYPAGLLFEWQRDHERRISEQLGKASSEIRQRYEKRHLEEFGRISYLAERLIVEKNDYWEYLLTAETLRYEISPVLRRWHALKRGLYVKPLAIVEKDDFFSWISLKMDEVSSIVEAFGELTNSEFKRSWGEPGVPGNDMDIVFTCRLFGEVCASALAWEESVRFSRVHECFKEVRDLCCGVTGSFLDHAEKIPKFLKEIIDSRPVSGSYELVLAIALPDGWADAVSAAMEQAKQAYWESG